MTKPIHISHKIELKPNNKAKTHFKKAFGCARLAYNWGLAKWKENYKNNIKTSVYDIRKEFNSIKRLIRLSRQLNKKQHPKTKSEALKGVKKSNNYIKVSLKLAKLHTKIANNRIEFLHKTTSVLVNNCNNICLETLQISNMLKNHKLAKSLSDVSLSKFNEILEYKAKYNGVSIHRADRFYPSSKTCSHCGTVKSDLKLSDRTFKCNECGYTIDRDYNASINLAKQLGQALPEATPADLAALLDDLVINNLITSKVEAGMQLKSYS